MNNLHSHSMKTCVKIVGWNPAIGSLITVIFALIITASLPHDSETYFLPYRVVDTIVPLFFGLQAAFLLSPETEPPVELLLSYGYGISKILWGRFFILVFLQGMVALTGNLLAIFLIIEKEPLTLSILRWLPACVFMGGTAVYTTIMTRQGVFGALLALLMWGGMLVGMDALLVRFPFLWPIHIYLQPDNASSPMYLLNRMVLILLGLGLIGLSANLARNEEHMLGLKGGKA